MKSRVAKTRFLKRLALKAQHLDALTPTAGIEAMLEYYSEERVDGCLLDEDGDMLLFQWGTQDWGEGPLFEVSIVRQLIASNDTDEEPHQLNLRFRFAQSQCISAGEGNQWCQTPLGLPEFRHFVVGSAAMQAVGSLSPESIELNYGRT